MGERAVLELVALRLLCAVAEPHTYAETAVMVECAGAEFSAKGRTVKQPGWRALDAAYRAGLKNAEPDKETEDKALPDGGRLPELAEGQSLPVAGAAVKEGKTTPPKHYTEDTLLSAMETAGKDEMPEDAERKGLGTPATRAGILEKLVSTGFLERKKSKKQVQLLPSHDAVSLITVLPEQLQSPLLTAEWEYRAPCSRSWWGPIRSSRGPSICSRRPVRWWANAPAAAVRLQKCKKASSVRINLAILQSGKTANGGP